MSIARITALQRGNSSVVEHNLAKVGVAGSIPVSRSTFTFNQSLKYFHYFRQYLPGWWNGRHKGLKIPSDIVSVPSKSGFGHHSGIKAT